MNRYLIDINGMGLRQALVTDKGIQPIGGFASGIALKKGKKTVFGKEAEFARAYAPRDLCDHFWDRLGPEMVEQGNFQCNYAELAASHLAEIYRMESNPREVVCLVPTHYQEIHRGILTAIAQDHNIPLRYIIPRPIAFCTSMTGKAHIHIDLGQNLLNGSWLANQPGMSVVESFTRHDLGYTRFLSRWLNGIAAEFINQWRFDPLHTPESEQHIRSSISSMLDTLNADPKARFYLSAFVGDNEKKIEVNTKMITGWSISLLSNIINEIKKLLSNGQTCEGVHLSFEAGQLPGLKTLVETELDLPVVSSAENEIFKGIADKWPPSSASDKRCLYLPYRLPVKESE